jgi:hypothetical protein
MIFLRKVEEVVILVVNNFSLEKLRSGHLKLDSLPQSETLPRPPQPVFCSLREVETRR